jgi:hypothetical protein
MVEKYYLSSLFKFGKKTVNMSSEAVRHERRFKMQGGKNLIFPKELHANWFFWDTHLLEIWSNHFCPSMGPTGGSVAMDSGCEAGSLRYVNSIPTTEGKSKRVLNYL